MANITIKDRINMRDFLKYEKDISFENFKATYPEMRYTKEDWDNLCGIFMASEDLEIKPESRHEEKPDYKITIDSVVEYTTKSYNNETYSNMYEISFSYENYKGGATLYIKDNKMALIKVDPKDCPIKACSELFIMADEDLDYLKSFILED